MTKIAPIFEIKVALLGNVSAGKTTILNALLRDKFGEVSLKRTTAGINYFRVFPKPSNDDSDSSASSGPVDGSPRAEWSMVPDDPRPADSILKEIETDNESLRQSNQVVEKTFEIQLGEEFLKMRKDTRLVVIDIPGINEAGSSSKYKDYVAEKWSDFDCVVVVMDGHQGVNTDSEMSVLEFAKANLSKKNIPLIILCNKVDDPEDEGQSEVVAEVRREVETIFEAPNREAALLALMSGSAERSEMFPVFIPISAVNGFTFRCASLLTLEQFKTFDKVLIDKLGRERIGRNPWRKMSAEERLTKAYEVVTDSEGYKAAIEESHFDKFLLALSYSIGGDEVQQTLIKEQIKVSLESVSSSGRIVSHLRSAYVKAQALSAAGPSANDPSVRVATLTNMFWRLYKECENSAFAKFGISPCQMDSLAHPMEELAEYHVFSKECGWEDEMESVKHNAKRLVCRQIAMLMSEGKSDPKFSAISDGEINCNWRWSSLSPTDWVGILGSMTLLSYNKFFCETFGKEKLMLEGRLSEIQSLNRDLLKGEETPCPSISCVGTLDFNRYCSSCCMFVLQEEVGPCVCGGSLLGHSGQHHCSSCSLKFQMQMQKACTKLDFLCPPCPNGHGTLDFHRRCNSCNIIFRLPGSLQSKKCPFCHYSLNPVGDSQDIQGCTRCRKQYQEVSQLGSLEMEYKDGEFVPVDPDFYHSVVRLEVPDSPSNAKHFGHLAWKYCGFMGSIAD